jgi:protein phosphatase
MKNTAEVILPTESGNPHLMLCGISDIGCVRETNEDNIYFNSIETVRNLPDEDILLIVADGMGGHNGGEVASKMVVDCLLKAHPSFGADVGKAFIKTFIKANRQVYRAARRNRSLTGMGTTCTALLVREKQAYCAHVGDSRIYLLRDGVIYRMTEDHTVLTEKRKKRSNQTSVGNQQEESSVLTRALGINCSVEIDTWPQAFPIKPNDRFLLCTDGLTDLVDDKEIKDTMTAFPLDEVCRRLVQLAKQRGGFDNISITAAFIGT